MSDKKTCEACGGCGYIVVGAGLATLEASYPDVPVREMNRRGWFGDTGDGEDVQRCDSAFLLFWGEDGHDAVRALLRQCVRQAQTDPA